MQDDTNALQTLKEGIDQKMKVMTLIALATKIREAYSSPPIISITKSFGSSYTKIHVKCSILT